MHQTAIVPEFCSPKNPCSDTKSSWGSALPHSLLEKLGEDEVKFSIIFLQLHEYFESMKGRLQHHGTCLSLENKRL